MNVSVKKVVYIICTMILGFLLAFIAHSILEIWFIRALLEQGLDPQLYKIFIMPTFLHPVLTLFIMVSGLLIGYFTGQAWWRIVYVELRHWRNKKVKFSS